MSEKEIVELLYAKDIQALDALKDKYSKLCKSISFNILSNEMDAEECVNDTFLKVWNSIPPQRPQDLTAYIAKLTRNTALDRYRKNTSRKRAQDNATLILDEIGEIVSGKDSVEDELYDKELMKEINIFLYNLSDEKRSVFVMRYFYGESIEKIAKRYGKLSGTVSVILTRTRREMKIYLQKRGYDL